MFYQCIRTLLPPPACSTINLYFMTVLTRRTQSSVSIRILLKGPCGVTRKNQSLPMRLKTKVVPFGVFIWSLVISKRRKNTVRSIVIWMKELFRTCFIFRTCASSQFLRRDSSKSHRSVVFWPRVFWFLLGAGLRVVNFWPSFCSCAH